MPFMVSGSRAEEEPHLAIEPQAANSETNVVWIFPVRKVTKAHMLYSVQIYSLLLEVRTSSLPSCL